MVPRPIAIAALSVVWWGGWMGSGEVQAQPAAVHVEDSAVPAYAAPPPLPGQRPPMPPPRFRYRPPDRVIPPGYVDGVRRHDGFLLRVQLGGVYSQAKTRTADARLHVYGGALQWNFGLGGALNEHWLLFGDFFGSITLTASARQGGNGLAGALPSLNLFSAGLGPGVAYYFMPSNVFLAASFGLGYASLGDEVGMLDETGVGFASQMQLGKEWWLGYAWALGAALQSVVMTLPDVGEERVRLFNLGLVLSLTYN